jgi:two-component system nitrate/nitrite response regulator NarL
MIRVVVIDDHPLFRAGVIQTLQAALEMEVVGQGTSVADAIRIVQEQRPDVIVLDMNLPDQRDGIRAVEAIYAESSSTRILMLTIVADGEIIRDVMQKGARGYILKGIGGADFLEAVRAVHHGECYMTPTLAGCLFTAAETQGAVHTANGAAAARLSAREDQILSFIAMGLQNKEIGRRLNLSDKTVKHYVTRLLQKLHVRNRTEAAIMAGHM